MFAALASLFVCALPGVGVEELTFERALEIALEGSQDVVRAKEDLLLADIERLRAISAVLPSFNVSSVANELFYQDYTTESRVYQPTQGVERQPNEPLPVTYGRFNDIYGTYSHPNFNINFTGRQLIFDGGRWWTVLARSKDIHRVRAASLATVQANLRLLVARRFFDLAKATRGVETFSLQVALAEDQLSRALQGLAEGRGKQNDVAAAERNLASDRVTLARRQFLESTRARLLNLALGREPETLFRLVLPVSVKTSTSAIEPIAIPATERLLELAAKERPEVRASAANLDIVRKNITIRAADYFPTIGLNASYLKSSRRPDRVFSDPSTNFYALVGIDVRWNLFAGGQTIINVEEGEIELRKGIAGHQELVRNVRAEVLDKVEQLRLLAKVVALNRNAARAAEQAATLVTAAYAENRASLFELRDAEFRLITARDAIFDARFDLEVAVEELRRAVGGDLATWASDAAQVIE